MFGHMLGLTFLILSCFTAEPPRKDGRVLVLSKLFLDACTRFGVYPVGQENPSQPFVSKHFNVIDPLRVNNNLGRSVSKGALLIKIHFQYLDLSLVIMLIYLYGL